MCHFICAIFARETRRGGAGNERENEKEQKSLSASTNCLLACFLCWVDSLSWPDDERKGRKKEGRKRKRKGKRGRDRKRERRKRKKQTKERERERGAIIPKNLCRHRQTAQGRQFFYVGSTIHRGRRRGGEGNEKEKGKKELQFQKNIYVGIDKLPKVGGFSM